MERDFMGLFVKQEAPEEIIDAAPVRSLPMQWSFSNKGSALPQLLSFNGAQEDKTKTGFESLASSGLVSLTTEPLSAAQQGGVRYTMTSYPKSAFLHEPFKAGVPMANPVVGTTDLRNSSKNPNAPAQLTIFYNGAVCVYENISPEKAQAIMLLAGNGTPKATPSAARSCSVVEGLSISPAYGNTPRRSSPIPSPVHVHPIKTEAKPSAAFQSSPIIAEPLRTVHPLRSATFLSSATVPQFRRKSLARFLEKRKERVISASPYGECQSPDAGAGGTSLSLNSSGSCPVPAAN